MNDRSGGGKVYTFSFKIKCELDLDGDAVFDDNGTLTVSWRIELNSDARLIIADETREYSLSHSSLRMRRVISDSKISELEPFTVEVSTDHAGERIMRYTYYNCSFKYRDKSPVYTKMYKNAEYILKSYNSTTKIYDCTYISAPISFYTTTISEYPFNASYLEYSVLLNDSNTNGIYDVCYMMLNYQPVVMATWLDVQNMLNDSISPYKTTFDNLTFTVVGDGHYKLHAFLDNFEYNFSSAPGYGANGSVYYDDEIKYGSNGILDEYKSELEWIFNDGSRCILSMQDLKTPLSAPPGAPEISDILMQYWMYILILVAALVATIVIIIIIRRKKKSQTK